MNRLFLLARLHKNKGFRKVEEASSCLEAMITAKPRPRTRDFAFVVSAVVRMKKYAAAVRLIERLDSFGLSNDLYVLNILANCLCHMKRADLAFTVLGRIFKIGFEPNAVTLNTLVDGLCREAKNVFEEMVHRGIK